MIALADGCVLDGLIAPNKADYGITGTTNSACIAYCTKFARIRNCDTGLMESTGAQGVIWLLPMLQYSNNTLDNNAVAASYGYIGLP